MSDIFDEDDIPAFLKGNDPNKIVDDLEDDDDFDFPTLDDDEQEELDELDDVTDADIGLEPEPAKPEPEKPAAPKAKAKETKSDKQAKLKQKADPQPEPPNIEPSNKRAVPGSNSGVDGGPLRAFIERIERLEEEKAAIGDDVKEVKAEAKGSGYDGKTINRILKLRKQDKAKREEEEALLHLYMFALGME